MGLSSRIEAARLIKRLGVNVAQEFDARQRQRDLSGEVQPENSLISCCERDAAAHLRLHMTIRALLGFKSREACQMPGQAKIFALVGNGKAPGAHERPNAGVAARMRPRFGPSVRERASKQEPGGGAHVRQHIADSAPRRRHARSEGVRGVERRVASYLHLLGLHQSADADRLHLHAADLRSRVLGRSLETLIWLDVDRARRLRVQGLLDGVRLRMLGPRRRELRRGARAKVARATVNLPLRGANPSDSLQPVRDLDTGRPSSAAWGRPRCLTCRSSDLPRRLLRPTPLDRLVALTGALLVIS